MIPRDTNEYHTNRFCRENFEKETRKAFFFLGGGGPFYSATTTMVKTSAARSEDSSMRSKKRRTTNPLSIIAGRKEGKSLRRDAPFSPSFKTKEGSLSLSLSSLSLSLSSSSLLVQTR